MKKLLIFLLLSVSAFATTTVTGTIRTLGTTTVGSGTFVRFWLRGCGGNQPRVSGSGVIAPSQGGVYFFDIAANGSGVVAGTIYSTRDNAGTGNGDIECGGSTTAVWYGMQIFLAGKGGPEVAVVAKNGATLDISNVTPITTNPVVTAPTGDSSYLRLDAGNSPVTGVATIKGVNGVLNAAQFPGADIGAQVNNAITSVVCGEVYIPAGTYSQSTTIQKPRCVNLRGASGYATTLTYTGTSYAIAVGDTSGVNNYPPGTIEDLVLSGTNVGQAILIGGDPAGIVNSSSSYADQQAFNRIKVKGFGAHAIQWGNNAWSNTFFESTITNNGDSEIYFPNGLTNSGEALGFISTQIQNSSGLGVNQVGFSMMSFTKCSFDFNANGSVLALATILASHFEALTGTLLTLNSTVFPPQVTIVGSHFQQDANSGVDANLISVTATNGPVLRVYGGETIANTGTHTATSFIQWTGSGGTQQEIVDGLNYQGSGVGQITSNLPCAFFGCRIQDIATGLFNTGYLIHARTYTIDPTYGNVNHFIGPTDQPLQIASQNNQNIALIPNGAGVVKIGTNNAAQIIGSGTATMTTAPIIAGNCGTTVTVGATGVAATDTITWAFNAAPAGTNAGLVAWPTANNVNFAYCSNTAETPAAATINWRVVR